ncbi:hypothetical protein OXX80_000253 [Metschnikowia pulcherrima]
MSTQQGGRQTKERASNRPLSFFLGNRRASALFARFGDSDETSDGPESESREGSSDQSHSPGPHGRSPGVSRCGSRRSGIGAGDNRIGAGDSVPRTAPQIYLGNFSSSSSQSSMVSFYEPAWQTEPTEYDDVINSNTLDADSGRRLQALQVSMCNPELSPSVRSILATAYRQFEKQSARTSETLPPYSHDCKPPPYSVR